MRCDATPHKRLTQCRTYYFQLKWHTVRRSFDHPALSVARWPLTCFAFFVLLHVRRALATISGDNNVCNSVRSPSKANQHRTHRARLLSHRYRFKEWKLFILIVRPPSSLAATAIVVAEAVRSISRPYAYDGFDVYSVY